MSVSGSKDYAVTRTDIINSALRRIGEYDQSETPDGNEAANAALTLNLMVKEWVARGIDIWLRDEVTVFLQPDTKSYALGTAHATRSYVETTLGGDEGSAETVLSVTSSTGMTASDFIGIKLDDNTIDWTTIVSVDSATQITVTDGLTSGATSGNKVYAYTTKAERPQKIVNAYRRDVNDIDTEVLLIGEKEYQQQSNKGSQGPVIQVWYHPTLTTGTLYVWPTDGGANVDKLVLSAQYLPDDFDAASNNPQFPIEWANTIIWNLAAELASEYGIQEKEQARLWRIAEHKLSELLAYDTENADVIFAMDYGR